MSITHLPGYPEALRAVMSNTSPRARRMADLERFVDGTQYEGQPDWFSDERPLWERAPCIVDPIVQNAIDSNKDLLLGDGRFPIFTVEDGEKEDDSDALDEVESVISRIVKRARLRMAAGESFASAQGTGAVAAIFGTRAGRLFVDTVKARWCTPELDTEGAVTRIEIRYPYLTEVKGTAGERLVKALIFRRLIDDKTDTTFLPADADPSGVEPEWVADNSKTFAHGLGFCPVVWYAHMRGCAIVGDVDGHAIHENLTDEVRAHDFTLSQRHRAAMFVGDPQWTEVGVDIGYNPTQAGRKPEVPTTLRGGRATSENPVQGGFHSAPSRGRARKKSPGTVWQYEDPNTVVTLHALPGDALDAIDKHARDLRIKIAQGLGVVFLDPETMPTATTISGRALEMLKARQLDKCDGYRVDFGDRFLLPSIGMLLRIALVKKLRIKGLDTVSTWVASMGDQWSWYSPPISLTWGRYFRLDSDEESKQVGLVVQAIDGGVATLRTAVEKLRGVLDVKDVDAYLEELEAEKAEALKHQQQLAAQMMRDTGDEDGADDSDENDDAEEPRARTSRAGNRRSPPPRAANSEGAASS